MRLKFRWKRQQLTMTMKKKTQRRVLERKREMKTTRHAALLFQARSNEPVLCAHRHFCRTDKEKEAYYSRNDEPLHLTSTLSLLCETLHYEK